jgi:predicted HTH domain antitoxin
MLILEPLDFRIVIGFRRKRAMKEVIKLKLPSRLSEKEAKASFAAGLVEVGKAKLSEGAAIANMSLPEFIEFLRKHGGKIPGISLPKGSRKVIKSFKPVLVKGTPPSRLITEGRR